MRTGKANADADNAQAKDSQINPFSFFSKLDNSTLAIRPRLSFGEFYAE